MLIPTEKTGCILRPWRAQDKSQLIRIADNRKIWRNLTDLFPSPYGEADAEFWIAHSGNCAPGLHLAIEWEGAVVGCVGVDAGTGVSCATGHFGYWLGEPFWGNGLATAAARSMAGHALSELLFERLEARVFEWNPASMRVLEKVGFVREGVLKRSISKDGCLIDSVVYARVRAG